MGECIVACMCEQNENGYFVWEHVWECVICMRAIVCVVNSENSVKIFHLKFVKKLSSAWYIKW